MSALSLWTDWLKQGLRPELGHQQHPDHQLAGVRHRRLRLRRERHLAAGNAKKAGFEYGIIPIPASDGGTAPAPTGGEFVTVPVQKDTARYATSQKLVTCLTTPTTRWPPTPRCPTSRPTEAVQAKQVAANPELKVWVEAVKAAKGRTGDNLGTKYPKISEPLWTAVQAALSGSKTPAGGADRRADRGRARPSERADRRP